MAFTRRSPRRTARLCKKELALQDSQRAVRGSAAWLGGSPQGALSIPIAAALALLAPVGQQRALAGDILRGGRAAAPAASRGIQGQPMEGPATAAAVNARDALARTSKAINSIRAMQDAAHQQARKSSGAAGLTYQGRQLPAVPNGLVTGGLKVAPGVPANLQSPQAGENASLWTGATLPVQQQKGGRTLVTIKQTAPRASLTWETFNIGKGTTLAFNQKDGGARKTQWIAFNKINDPSGIPSQILGSIVADGQVYVINRNGIVFGGSSVVNTHTLVASSLAINENLISRGLLNQETKNPQFLFSSVFTDPTFNLAAGESTYVVSQKLAAGTKPRLSFRPDGATSQNTLAFATDYTLSEDAAGKTVVTFTADGLTKVGAAPVTLTYTGTGGDVVVQRGAQLSAPTSSAKVGGRIALVGPNVRNSGTISTPDGQTILAAGRQVGFAPHPSTDPTLRGLDVFVGQVDRQSGTARNDGLISIPRGSASMSGRNVQQMAAIDSSTSVTLNGRIDLDASYNALTNVGYNPILRPDVAPFLLSSTGTVTLGPGSVTRILPELQSEEKVVGTELALRSQANLRGKIVHFAEDAELLAPNANVAVRAGIWNAVNSEADPFNGFVHTGGQIYVEKGAVISAAGSPDVGVKLGQNLLTLQLRGAELADSPLQRTGALRGASLTIDVRENGVFNGLAYTGTPLGDASGFAGLIERTVGELTVAGGSVTLQAGGSVVLQGGSKIDVSGGFINFQSGVVQTSRVQVGAQLLDISRATPDQIYDGIYTGTFLRMSAKWGVAETFRNPLALTGAHFEEGYLQGASGGSLTITAPSMALDGELLGRTINGARQRAVPAALSSLALAFTAQAINPISPTPLTTSPTPPMITFSSEVLEAAEPFVVDEAGEPSALRADRLARVVLSPGLFTIAGFGKLTVDNGDGDILLPVGVKLETPVGGALTLRGANISLLGDVRAPGGSLSFFAYNTSPYLVPDGDSVELPVPNAGRGRFVLGASTLSAAGRLVDDRNDFVAGSPLATAGGSISIQAFQTELRTGSTLDVSGGIGISPAGRVSYRNAGSITIAGGQDPANKAVVGGSLEIGSTLRGFSGDRGGSLSILAPRISVGGQAGENVLKLAPSFFSKGGFASFSLTGLGTIDPTTGRTLPAVEIAPGTVLRPVAQSWLAQPNGPGEDVFIETIVKPTGLRAPFTLSLRGAGVSLPSGALAIRGDLVMGERAVIALDPSGDASLTGQTVAILGSIRAPGGSITVQGANAFPLPVELAPAVTNAAATVYLGPRAVLSTAGTTVLTPDAFGRRTGTVLPGGTIRIAGNIVADAGALLDVSGGSGMLDLAPMQVLGAPVAGQPLVSPRSGLTAPLWSVATLPMKMESNGGTLVLQGGEMLFTDATLRGNAGGPTALGGSLSVSSGRFYLPDTLPASRSNADINLVVSQSGLTRPQTHGGDPALVLGRSVQSPTGSPLSAMGHFRVDQFASGGFDGFTLGGNVLFTGNVEIAARRELKIATGGVLSAFGKVELRAPYVALGQPFVAPLAPGQALPIFVDGATQPVVFAPTYGRGQLSVEASLIDVGNLSLQNIGRTTLSARNGDIRGNGTLDVAGDLVLRAGQIYPATGTTFTVAAYDKAVPVASSTLGSPSVTLASATLPPGFRVGSSLLGSTVQSIEGTNVTLATGADRTISSRTASVFAPGSIRVEQAGSRDLPLSAGGTLNLYASRIDQDGTFRAPLGTINLGWDGTGTAPQDLLSRAPLPFTSHVVLGKGSITSVSAIDPRTGQGLILPFGFSTNGTDFISPSGVDISAGLVPGKAITIGGQNVSMAGSATVDQRGGGDLFAYRFNRGIGGSTDLLGWNMVGNWQAGATYREGEIVSYQGAFYYARTALDGVASSTAPKPGADWRQVSQSFAVMPGYQADFAPYARFNSTIDPGYTGGTLAVGDRVQLQASAGLAEGTYTLLPARYALLPGAVLVTPQTGLPLGTVNMLDGGTMVGGYRFNSLNGERSLQPVYSRFEVASADVVRQRGEYQDFMANTFLAERAEALGLATPRLPQDAGHVILQATNSMSLAGRILSQGNGGESRAGLIDLAVSSNIVIGGADVAATHRGSLGLDAGMLNRWGAESLLIGGTRTLGPKGATVTVRAANITVSNASSPLNVPDLALVAKDGITIAPGATIVTAGKLGGSADTLLLGDAKIAGSGNGVLFRASADADARVIRSGTNSAEGPTLTIGANARLVGNSLTLDSTSAMFIDSAAELGGEAIALNTGRVSIRLDEEAAVPADAGLVLEGALLRKLQNTERLSLGSYSTLDVYGAGEFRSRGTLALHAGTIRGIGAAEGIAKFTARTITLDNAANSSHTLPSLAPAGTLAFVADQIVIGRNQLFIDQYSTVELTAGRTLTLQGQGGLNVAGDLVATTPALNAAARATQGLAAGGALTVQAPEGRPAGKVASGLGADVTLKGSSVAVTTGIGLPSGRLTLQATTGDIVVGGRLDVGGTSRNFFDQVRNTDAGEVRLLAEAGNVQIAEGGLISVAGALAGGDAGTLTVGTPQGTFTLEGKLLGRAGAGGDGGRFVLDAATAPEVNNLLETLTESGFTESQKLRIRTGDVALTSNVKVRNFTLSTDSGSITVGSSIDVSGRNGGRIALVAAGNLSILAGAVLDASSETFSNAGKGGSISLETRGLGGGVVDLRAGSTIDLSVDAITTSADPAAALAEAARRGQFGGTLQLRAPQLAGGTDLQIGGVASTILGASRITAEGYKVYTVAGSAGTITTTLQNQISADGIVFGSKSEAISGRLLAGNSALDPLFTVLHGAEIINPTGNITLGSASSTAAADWNLGDLTKFRFGPKQAPGVLTLRAAGDLVFYNALSDGFVSATYNARLLENNPLLAANNQSWSYRLTAGADLAAADVHAVQPLATLQAAGTGSLLVGKNAGLNQAPTSGSGAQTSAALANRFQSIRTGSGDIEISAGQDVRLLNQFSNIYTAGTQLSATEAGMGGTFDLPRPSLVGSNTGRLGANQQSPAYPAQFSMAGGDVTIQAQGDMRRMTRDLNGELIDDSQKEMPTNWLYRRGAVDPATGLFALSRYREVASTAWWVDFSNFFEGVGALGGGNVTMEAGGDIRNLDAVIPTNARMPGKDATGLAIAPNAAKLVELGGGDLKIKTGGDLDAGVYYVERGRGTIEAGADITTNETRSPSLGRFTFPNAVLAQESWLPTTLFVGKGSFDVNARGDLLLGPVSNPFLLPQGFSNSFWYKTYYSTFDPGDAVRLSSLGGSITLRNRVTLPSEGSINTSIPMLEAWYGEVLRFDPQTPTASFYQPWLRLAETSVTPFSTAFSLLPATLQATAFSGDINIVGSFNLAASPTGTLELLAKGSLNGLQVNGSSMINGQSVQVWDSARINVSDSDPAALIGPGSPFAYQTVLSSPSLVAANTTGDTFLQFLDPLFLESGSTTGVYAAIQTKQALHGAGLLHAEDREPVRLYAGTGDVADLTLFSPKAARVLAGRDITDIGFYLQNVQEEDVSVISAGRDIVAYNANSPSRAAATTDGNYLAGTIFGAATSIPDSESGDLQISGPGTLVALAGRNFDLGSGANRADGTGVGLTSIGNARNLNLPFEGASIVAGAGLGAVGGLTDQANLHLDEFIAAYLDPASENGVRYLPELGKLMAGAAMTTGMPVQSAPQVWKQFQALPKERQASLALEVFYRVLRDAGRDSIDPLKPTFGTYDGGTAAIAMLFGGTDGKGDITTQGRDVRTRNGGNISLLAPGGSLTLAKTIIGNPQIPPGVVTESGGNISVFTDGNVDIGISRIFTLRGGDVIIWSSNGDIAAGTSAKTVRSAPPTRVLIDPQSADVQTDLAGLATGGGIGVLATVADVPPGNVDLIAPSGTIDAGDAGIRATGNLNLAATTILNADNISVGGSTAGAPAAAAAPSVNIAGLSSASNVGGSATTAADEAAKQSQAQAQESEPPESIISVDVTYGE